MKCLKVTDLYLNKKEVERTELEPDIYAPKPQIIYVGTRKRPEN